MKYILIVSLLFVMGCQPTNYNYYQPNPALDYYLSTVPNQGNGSPFKRVGSPVDTIYIQPYPYSQPMPNLIPPMIRSY